MNELSIPYIVSNYLKGTSSHKGRLKRVMVTYESQVCIYNIMGSVIIATHVLRQWMTPQLFGTPHSLV